jgi:pimeloyl-ACP methyl ester carboxylesterase
VSDLQQYGQYADLPGVRLWYLDLGGDGVPVVFLHANTGTSEKWEPQLETFRYAGYRPIAFDRRGWGKSQAEPSTGVQPGSVSEDLDALVDHLKLPRFHIVGVAGGGFVTMDYCSWRPEKLRSAVIGASMGSLKEPDVVEFSARIKIPGIHDQPAMYREVGASYRGSNPEGVARWNEIHEHSKQPGATDQPLRTPNTYAKLDTITTPMLVLGGAADLLAPLALMKKWTAHVPHHEWVVIPEAGHSISWEFPEEFNQYALEFLARH